MASPMLGCIRTTASVGASLLLFDWVGADKSSVGPPVRNIVGVPFQYAQYRFLVGQRARR